MPPAPVHQASSLYPGPRIPLLCAACRSFLDAGPCAAHVMVRLCVGGLDAEVTSELLSARFASFGAVSACEIVARKSNDVSEPRLAPRLASARRQSATAAAAAEAVAAQEGCRGFAYVELEPKDDAALQRCLSTVSRLPCTRTAPCTLHAEDVSWSLVPTFLALHGGRVAGHGASAPRQAVLRHTCKLPFKAQLWLLESMH